MKQIPNIVVALFCYLLLILGFLHPVNAFQQDLGRHLLTGKLILQTHQVPLVNLYSYTFPNFPFINTHWFSEVVFYVIQQTVGVNGLLIITILCALTAFTLVFFYEFTKRNVLVLGVASLLYLRILFERTDVRPEIFSFLFLSIFIITLYRYTQRFTKLIFLLPIFELLWVNMHIYYFVGLGVIGLFLVDEIVKKQFNNKKAFASSNKAMLYLVLVFLLSFTATFLNPNGVQGALYPLHAMQNYGYQIEENQNIFFLQSLFNKPSIVPFEISVFLLFLGLLLTSKRVIANNGGPKPIDWLLAISFTVFGIMSVRNLPLFVFVTFITFTRSWTIILSHLQTSIHKSFPKYAHGIWLMAYCIMLIFFVFQMKFVIDHKPIGQGTESGAEKGADFLTANNLKGPIFNNFDIGSYLEYRTFPKEKVFVDGRPEAYPKYFFANIYIPMQQDPTVFTAVDHRYNFSTIFFSHTDQTPWAETFLKSIVQNNDWSIVYLDDYIIVLLRKNGPNKSLIDKFGMGFRHVKVSNLNDKNLVSLYRLASFFNKVGLVSNLKMVDEKILSLYQNNCTGLSSYASILLQEQNPSAQIYAQRFQNNCE